MKSWPSIRIEVSISYASSFLLHAPRARHGVQGPRSHTAKEPSRSEPTILRERVLTVGPLSREVLTKPVTHMRGRAHLDPRWDRPAHPINIRSPPSVEEAGRGAELEAEKR